MTDKSKFSQKRVPEITTERARTFAEHYEKCGYQIIEQNGKYGLSYNRIPVLEPVYSSMEISNTDSNEYTLAHFRDDSSVIDIQEVNFPIVMADGKCGLLLGSEIKLNLDYQRIIKLSFCHYLCQKDNNSFVLYNLDYGRLKPQATFTTPEDLSLSKFLEILMRDHPRAYSELRRKIAQFGDQYHSKYRYYVGTQVVSGSFHGFEVASVVVVLNDDFSTS